MREVTEFYCEHCQALIGQEYTFEDGKKFLQAPGCAIYGPVGILICSACDHPNVWSVVGRIPYAEYLANMKRILEGQNGAVA